MSEGKAFTRDKAGRPTKINEQMIEDICKAIRAGNYIETAAGLNGINKDTIYDWVKRGARERQRIDKGEKPNPKERLFAIFSDEVEKARAEGEARHVMIVSKAGETQWQASAWWLERRDPERWGRQRIDINHSGSIEQGISASQGVIDQLKARGKVEVDE